MDMFGSTDDIKPRVFFDYAVAGDKKGALDRLHSLSPSEAEKEIVLAGFSSIGFRRNSKGEMIAWGVNQIGVKTPVLHSCDSWE